MTQCDIKINISLMRKNLFLRALGAGVIERARQHQTAGPESCGRARKHGNVKDDKNECSKCLDAKILQYRDAFCYGSVG